MYWNLCKILINLNTFIKIIEIYEKYIKIVKANWGEITPPFHTPYLPFHTPSSILPPNSYTNFPGLPPISYTKKPISYTNFCRRTERTRITPHFIHQIFWITPHFIHHILQLHTPNFISYTKFPDYPPFHTPKNPFHTPSSPPTSA